MKIVINYLLSIIMAETTADYCFTHKLENMVNVKSKRCIHENCDKIPNFNNFGETTANIVLLIN
jgi:hypothetical protein